MPIICTFKTFFIELISQKNGIQASCNSAEMLSKKGSTGLNPNIWNKLNLLNPTVFFNTFMLFWVVFKAVLFNY